MERNDVLLVSPPSRMDSHYRPPLGLMYVASYYRDIGLSVRIADYPFAENIRNANFWRKRDEMVSQCKVKVLNEVYNTNPKLIGISCYSTEYNEVLSLIKDIRKISKADIIVGGIHPTLKPHDFDGIAQIHQGRLDKGYACYDLVDMKHYLEPNPYLIRGVLLKGMYIVSGFGCPNQCTFCVASTLKQYFKSESKTPQVLYDEVVMLKDKYGIDGFYIIDDLYTINKEKVKEFCSLVAKTGLIWGCCSRVNTVDEETIKQMSKAGCIQLDFGVERGSNEALQRLKKGITIEQIKETFRLCEKYHLRTFANFLVNIPEETKKDREDIEKLVCKIKPTITCINIYEYYEGCKLGLASIPDSDLLQWKRRCMLNSNWNSGIKWSSLKHLKLKYYKALSLVIKEGLNQLFSH